MKLKTLVRRVSVLLAAAPLAVAAEERLILYHELDGAGNIIRSIALDDGMFELVTVVVAVLVFCTIIRFVMGD